MLDFDSEIYDVEEIPAPKSIWQRICEVARNFGVWFGDNWGFLFTTVFLSLLFIAFLLALYSSIRDFNKTDSGPFTVIDNGHTYTNLTYKAGRYYDSSNTYQFSERATIIKLTK